MQQRIGNRTAKINSIRVFEAGIERLVQINRNIIFMRSDDGREVQFVNSYDPRERAPWCIQVIAQPNHCLLVNLGYRGIQSPSVSGTRILNTQSTERLAYDEIIQLDNFSFTFYRKRLTDFIELDFSLPPELTHLHTEENPLEGTITLHNKGDQPKVQFYITEVEGLAPGTYHFDSRQPKLIHVRDRAVKFYLYHTSDNPITAGYYYVGIYAKTDEYPGEVADFQEIYVHPYYEHALELETF